MRTGRHTAHRAALAPLVVALALSVMACTRKAEPGAPPSPPASTVEPSSSGRAAAERDAQAAFGGFINAWVKAGETANSEEPELRRYAQGLALKALVSRMLRAKADGKVFKGKPTFDTSVKDATPADVPTTVNLDACLDGTNWLEYRASDGKPWDDVPGGPHAMTAVVKKDSGSWKVDSFTTSKVGTC